MTGTPVTGSAMIRPGSRSRVMEMTVCSCFMRATQSLESKPSSNGWMAKRTYGYHNVSPGYSSMRVREHLLCLDQNLALATRLWQTVHRAVIAAGRPHTLDTRGRHAVGGKDDTVHPEAFNELRARIGRVREVGDRGASLLIGAAAEMTSAAVVLGATRILITDVAVPAELLGAMEDDFILVVVANGSLVGPEGGPHAVDAVIKFGRAKQRQAGIDPFLANIVLRLQAHAPVDGTAATPRLASGDGNGGALGDDEAVVLVDMLVADLTEGKAFRRKVIALIRNEHAMAGLGQVLG
ncbi:hypothetical protein HC256_005220 [Beauveria bassiana]|nr:hypothetical protein HC256_005220 [Beauveria bassiana]